MPVSSRFLLLGEPLALDLVNTRLRRNGADVELLDTPAALAAWLRAEHERLTWKGALDQDDLHAVRTLRDAIGKLLHALRAQVRPTQAALRSVNQALSHPGRQLRITWPDSAPVLAAPQAHGQREALLHALATDAAGLLTGPMAGRVRECAHPDCVLQFLARNPNRRWCSDLLCGNRARVARHYRTHRAPSG